MPSTRRMQLGVVLVCAVGWFARLGYVMAQAGTDPTFGRPALDGAVYWAWAGRLIAGEGSPPGAYYLAPLYPFALAALRAIAGDGFVALLLLQHAMTVATAWLLARVAALSAGATAAIATAVLCIGYHPTIFFASRPLSEPLALVLAAVALRLAVVDGDEGRDRRSLASGAVAGLAALARANLLLLVPAWAASLWFAGRRRPAILLLTAAIVVVTPVAWRNLAASGHLVPISSNAGLTLYHGNAPGARGGMTASEGFSGAPASQRAEATAIASRRSGLTLDAVEADRWWGRRAIDARLAAPGETLRLLARRAGLTLANVELGLDAAPALDANPWRRVAPIPFALIAGLAAAAVVARGLTGSGGRPTWAAIAVCAVTPLVFYVSSRYRLPLAVLLTVPAGCGVAAIVEGWRTGRWRGVMPAVATALAVIGVSLSMPTGTIERTQTAAALANRVSQRAAAGDLAGALRDADASLALMPSALAQFNRGVALRQAGRDAEAESAWRAALELDPGHAEAAGNLAGLLITSGRPLAAIPLLERALASRPGHAVCWTNLVVAQFDSGRLDAARRAASTARSLGVELDAGLLEAIGADGP